MASYRLSSKIISRSQGKNIVACAAYRAGEKLHDERTDEIYDYTRKQDVAYNTILLPEGAPEWMADRQRLWNVVESTEKRKDSQLAREVQLSLPRELTLSQNIQLTREFVKDQFVTCGMVADISIHIPKASDGGLQPHAHVLLTMREIQEQEFGLKAREWNNRCELKEWREEWGNYQNRHLALHGHDMRVDHRSLKDQGIDLLPQKKIGPTGLFHRMASYAEQRQRDFINGERLLQNPEIVLDVITRQQSTFTHNDIARVVNRYTLDSEQFLAVYEKVKALPLLVSLGQDDKGRARFTTQPMLSTEKTMLEHAADLSISPTHAVSEAHQALALSQKTLTIEQKLAFDHVVEEGALKCVIGLAGTGKSYFLGVAREAWEQAGYNVLGATLSGIAAENLEGSSGIASRTLASRFYYWDKGEELLTANDVLVVDEAGMVGTHHMARVMEEAKAHGAKVILVGDMEQLQAIDAGASFRGIVEKTGYVELAEIWRQNSQWQRSATVQLATQKTQEAMAQYASHGHIHTYETKIEAMHALVSHWNDLRVASPEKTQIMLAYTRQEVLELNQIARGYCQESGMLSNEHRVLTERGDRQFSEGERIYFLKNDRELGVKNGTLGTIVGLNNTALTVRLDNVDEKEKHQTISFTTDRYNHLDYGYAATIYKGQGVTVDRAFVLSSRYLDRHATYVAMTRHRDGVELFWSKEEFPQYDDMVGVLSRERSKDLVSDYLQDFDTASFAERRGMDTLWDTFLEKYGAQWLEKIQRTMVICSDGAKALLGTVKEIVGIKDVISQEHDELAKNDVWLDEMRAIRDEAYKNNPGLEKELLALRNGHDPSKEQPINRDTAIPLIEPGKPITPEQRAYYEEKYQKLMQSQSLLPEDKISNIPPIERDKPITPEQRAYYEERYQKIMQEMPLMQSNAEKNCLQPSGEKTNPAMPENKVKYLGKEMEMEL